MKIKKILFLFDRAKRHALNQDFCYSFSFFLPCFLGGKRKGEKKTQSRDFKSCLSAWSFIYTILKNKTPFVISFFSSSKEKEGEKKRENSTKDDTYWFIFKVFFEPIYMKKWVHEKEKEMKYVLFKLRDILQGKVRKIF